MAPNTRMPSRTASSTGAGKRKRDNETLVQRQVAQKLHLCADVSDAVAAARRSLQRQLLRYKAQEARADELGRLHSAFEQTTHFQAFLGAELDGEDQKLQQVTSLHKKTIKLVRKVVNKKRPIGQRTQKIVTQLPRLMEKATSVVSERRQVRKEQQELPKSHQWVPMVLWKLYDDVLEVSGREDEAKPLKNALHDVMKTLREINPYFYLQVLYQPPPEHVDGQWEVRASEKVTAFAESMTPFFRDLRRRSFALKNKRDPNVRIRYGWNELRVTLTFVRRAARHFHFLILHLYAMAMGCASPHVHAGVITEKAASGICRADAELRARLGLCREAAVSEDNLTKETYEWTPELLAYLDEWKHYRSSGRVLFGFTHDEREEDFLPRFSPIHKARKHSRRIPRLDVLAEISYHLRDVNHVWRASKLGTSDFKGIRIEDIGALETKIKGNLAAVVDLVYKMMLARWMDRRKRSDVWWNSIAFHDRMHVDDEEESLAESTAEYQLNTVGGTTSEAMDFNDGLQDVTDVESVEYTDTQRTKTHLPTGGAFRSPTTMTLREVVDRAKEVFAAEHSPSNHVTPRLLATVKVPLRNIYAWSDKEIDDFVRKTERITDVRAAMLDLHKRLTLPQISHETLVDAEMAPTLGNCVHDDWRMSCIASHLCGLMNKAVAYAEETALHGAAKALMKRPSLRLTPTPTPTVPVEDSDSKPDHLSAPEKYTVQELQKSVRKAHQHLAGQLHCYEGEQTAAWLDFIQSTGRSTTQLLRIVSKDEAFHNLAVTCESNCE